jgi:hypothetical protein
MVHMQPGNSFPISALFLIPILLESLYNHEIKKSR